MRILALHIRDTKNAGDAASCPLDYFAFDGHEVVKADMRSAPDCDPDFVIYGGGSIIASPDFHSWRCPVIAWGVGHHERNRPWGVSMLSHHKRAAETCALYFPRDRIDGFARTPCASCMHPVFDEDIRPAHGTVCYSAARRVDVNNGLWPHMTNEDGTIEDAVRFLGSGETVVTSSYHGAYWAHLLGRDVRVVSWGSKFDHLPVQGLAECREMNAAAYGEVLRVLH